MELIIRSKNMDMTDEIKEMLEKEIGRLEKFLPEEANAHVMVKRRKNYFIVEITIPMKRYTLRAEEEDRELRTAVDRAKEVMERQIRKYKTRLTDRKRKEKIRGSMNEETDRGEDSLEEIEDPIKIVRSKRFDLESMTDKEACMQMDLLGHGFFVFEDADSGEICVAYRRTDEKYGIIETRR